jgi:transcriptional regulator with XRE-family HTH domain
MEFLSEILEWKPVPEDTLVYFQERLRHRLHSAILDAFTRRAKERGLKQKDLAARIHKSSVQINRWLSTASNLTLDSISDLMVGLGMDFDAFPFRPIEKTLAPNERQINRGKNSDRAFSNN